MWSSATTGSRPKDDKINIRKVHSMNKKTLAAAVAAKTGLSGKDAERAVSATLEAISEALAAGERVLLIGFGTFETKLRAPRIAQNPKTLEKVAVPATRLPAFKPGQLLKTKVAEK